MMNPLTPLQELLQADIVAEWSARYNKILPKLGHTVNFLRRNNDEEKVHDTGVVTGISAAFTDEGCVIKLTIHTPKHTFVVGGLDVL